MHKIHVFLQLGYEHHNIATLFCSDEVYGLSVYKEGSEFTSALCLKDRLVSTGQVAQEAADAYFHFVYGLSKDWCASGLRVGMLYSKNAPLHLALNSLAPFSSISNYQQHLLADMLSDESWTDMYIKFNADQLRKSYDMLTTALDEAEIPFVPAEAGMFVWIDMRKYLSEPSWHEETALWKKICDEAKVILTPGKSCHAAEPGFFRLCFAWVPPEANIVAIRRIQQALGEA